MTNLWFLSMTERQRMSERQRQLDFYRQLMQGHDCEKSRELQTRIREAERDEWCIRSALGWAVLLVILSGGGLGYCAVLLPDFFDSSTPVSVEVFAVLLMASLISLIGFVCYWCWYRRERKGLYHECQTWIVSSKEANLSYSPGGFDDGSISAGPPCA